MNIYYLEEHIHRVLRMLENEMLGLLYLDDIDIGIEASYQVDMTKKMEGLEQGSYLVSVSFQKEEKDFRLFFTFHDADSEKLESICACIKLCIVEAIDNPLETLKEHFPSLKKEYGCEFLKLMDAIIIPSIPE